MGWQPKEEKPATGGFVDPDTLGKYTFPDSPEFVVPIRTLELRRPPIMTIPVCSWDWNKMTSTEREGYRRCNCYDTCYVNYDRIRDARILRSRERKRKFHAFFQRIKSFFTR